MRTFLLIIGCFVVCSAGWSQKGKEVKSSARHLIDKSESGEAKMRNNIQKKALLQPPVLLSSDAATKPGTKTTFTKTDL